jgi:uncharacterized membrane protein YjgN (DUF898 family)
MVSFPLSLLLVPYAVIIAVVVFLAFINLRNLARYRAEDVISFAAIFIFLAGAALLAYFSYNYLSPIDWKEMIALNFNFGKFNF